MTWILQRFTGDPGLPKPWRIHRSTWSTDLNSLGSTSYASLHTEESDFQALASPLPSETDPRLLFAGEATHEHFYGTMHGARLAGLREAKRVLERTGQVERIGKELDKISKSQQQQKLHLVVGKEWVQE